MADYMSDYSQQGQGAPISPWAAGAIGAGAGAAGVGAYSYLKTSRTLATAGSLLGGVGVANQVMYGTQASNVQSAAGQIATASNALTFTAGGATGAEVGALRGQVVQLANQVQNLGFYGQVSNLWGANAQPVQPVPSAGPSAGSTVTTVSSSNNNGFLVLGAALAAYAILR